MTEAAPHPVPTSDNDAWTQQLGQLKARYKHVREPVLVALNILLHDPNVALDDAKAQAALHGVRITAASVSAAQRLLSRRDDAPAPKAAPAAVATPPAKPRTRRTPKADTPVDIEGVVRDAVTRISAKAAAEAERLRVAMRKAIRALEDALA